MDRAPRSTIWIPGEALHAIKATGVLEGCNAFVDRDVDTHLPYFCKEGGAASRLVAVLLDELAGAGQGPASADADRPAAAQDRR